MEPKKISFGFSKITKKPNILPVKAAKPEQQVELIKCLEGQQIQLVEERQETAPIVIPMKESGKTSSALASLMRRRAVLLGEEEEPAESNTSKTVNVEVNEDVSNDDLEKRAVREIMADLQNNKETVQDNGLVLPILKPDELPLDGAKESNLDDYESIPIEQYGMAMLRGMGWVEPPPSKQKKLIDDAPMVRPKGMGLGADKALKAKPLLVQPEANEILEIKKLAYVRILGGKHKDAYGQIEGFDDEAGRVIVKLAIGGAKEAFNEFLCQPVSKKEFAQYGKCINTAKYEEYKKMENENGQIIVKTEEPKLERKEKKVTKIEEELKHKPSIASSNHIKNEKSPSKQRYDEYPGSSSNRDRARSRSHSNSRSRKYTSNRRYDDETYSDDNSGSSTNDSDTDSAYERRHKHHTKSKSKSKSHAKKSKSSKKKSHRHRSSSESSSRKTYNDSSYSDESDDERESRRHRHGNKKNKKKTKKSKKQRSRTPSRHRR